MHHLATFPAEVNEAFPISANFAWFVWVRSVEKVAALALETSLFMYLCLKLEHVNIQNSFYLYHLYHTGTIFALYRHCTKNVLEIFLLCSKGYHLDEWLVCELDQMKFDTYVSDTDSFAYLKWVKTTKFLISRNATNMSATNQHSSKWFLLRCHSKCYKCVSFTFCSYL